MEKKTSEEKNKLKTDVSKSSMSILIYTLIMILIVTIIGIVQLVVEVIKNTNTGNSFNIDEFMKQMMSSGTSSIIAVIIGIYFLNLFFYKIDKNKILESRKSMNLKRFIEYTICFIGIQLIFTILSYVIEGTLNNIGYTMKEDIETATSLSSTISMFLYASIIGPISEEIVFRGFILKSLEKHGRLLSIVISSILFGAFHMNLLQGVFATLVGIILGYIAIEYSIKWSMLLHVLNNLLFNDVLGYMISGFSESTQNSVYFIIELICFALGLIIIYINKKQIKMYIKDNNTHNFKVAFSSIGFIICMMILIVSSFSGISKL